MLRVIVTAILLLVASGTSAGGQTLPAAAGSSYLFFDTPKVGWKASMNSPSKAQIAVDREDVDAGERNQASRRRRVSGHRRGLHDGHHGACLRATCPTCAG
jgi:hypothetical protein